MKGRKLLRMLLGLSAATWLVGCAHQRDEYLSDSYLYESGSGWQDRHPFWERGQGHWDPFWGRDNWSNARWR